MGQGKRNSRINEGYQQRSGRNAKFRTRQLTCYVCGNNQHHREPAQLNTAKRAAKGDMTGGIGTQRSPFYPFNSKKAKPDEWFNESCVLITLRLNGTTTRALIDSGAQPSIIDMKSLADIGASYQHSPNRVHSMCNTYKDQGPCRTKR